MPTDKSQRERLKACSRFYDEVESMKELVRRFDKNKEEQRLLFFFVLSGDNRMTL